MSATYRKSRFGMSGCGGATVSSAMALLLSALLTALALRVPGLQWLGCLSFLPLFVVIRRLRPRAASLAGGVWGGCLYAFYLACPTPAIDTLAFTNDLTSSAGGLSVCAGAKAGLSAWLLALLIVIPAVYIGLATRLARGRAGILPTSPTIGPNILLLALGWTLVEAVLHFHNVFSPHEGLLTGTQGEVAYLHWLARLMGYVCMALLAACANASLVGILSGARLSFPTFRSLAGSPIAVAAPRSPIVLPIQSWTLRQGYPRGPPIPAVSTT
ncbi:MAG: hypothetical protein ABII12_08865 [Planctomycetota bacterium]